MALQHPEDWDRATLLHEQATRWQALWEAIRETNPFYRTKSAENGSLNRDSRDQFPFTTKQELLDAQSAVPPYGPFLTYPRSRYSRLHQTSGTSNRPLRWLDTPESWNWLLDCWDQMFRMIGLRPDDRLFFPFSFGPFLGFWTAFEAAVRRGQFCLPGGGMSSAARLRFLLDHEATVLFCTPTYALRLAEVARQEGIDLAGCPVRLLVVAGEPGGSILATRTQLEKAWGARVIDHSGMTEVGALAIECLANPAGLHVLESEYIAEVIDPHSLKPVPAGEVGELVLTNLGRLGSPLIRYRTGDLVRIDPQPCPCGRALVRFPGGILGRTDDMIHFRGNNLYPSALEAVLRGIDGVGEFQVEIDTSGALPVLRIAVEPANGTAPSLAERVEQAVRDTLLFRAEVTTVAPESLPRYEMKSRRIRKK